MIYKGTNHLIRSTCIKNRVKALLISSPDLHLSKLWHQNIKDYHKVTAFFQKSDSIFNINCIISKEDHEKDRYTGGGGQRPPLVVNMLLQI